jgi:hypothetical protein
MTKAGRGKIINLSGGGATTPMPGFSAYAASKAAVVRFTETLAMELAGSGVEVNAVAPGLLKTRMMDQMLEAGPERAGHQQIEAVMRSAETGGTPPALATRRRICDRAVDSICEHDNGSRMNITLSVPEETAAKAKLVAARRGETLSAWFRHQVAKEMEEVAIEEIAAIDPQTAAAVGCALPLEEHWEDARWRALAEKHLR